MKKILSLLAMLIAVNFSYAQTNTLPSSGNVGIGTTSPLSPLTVGSNTSNMQSTTGLTLGSGQNNVEFLNSTFGSGFGAKIYGVDSGSGVTTLRIATRGNSTTWKDAFTVNASASGNGNVGIGTTSPQTKLHVYQSTADQAALTLQGNTINTDGAQHYVAMNMDGDYGNATGNYSQIRSYSNLYGSWGSQLAFFTTQSGVSNILAERMRIDYSGNVGIGTTSPGSLLHLYSSGANNMLRLQFNASGGGNWSINPFIYGVNNGGLSFVNVQSSTTPLVIDASDNVGIGTTTVPTGYKLAVNGSMIATSIKVKPYANWPDYVFKPEYKLPSLAEVKKYIDQNQHLPDVPSEQEVVKDGVDLGEIVKIQTKKIEELTLYLIEKDNQDKAKEKQFQSQQKEINELNRKLSLLLSRTSK